MVLRKWVSGFVASAIGFGAVVMPGLEASATDWRVMGVSRRTNETVALDMNSIQHRSQYDVRFRYLIGKDVVNASVNCTSSRVTPNKGAAFVPDMTGATRNIVTLVCRHGGLPGDDDNVVNSGVDPIAARRAFVVSPGVISRGCTFRSTSGTELKDRCRYSESGKMSRFLPKNATVRWSDGVTTRIEFATIESLRSGVIEGTAIVDGEKADFVQFGTGGMCIDILKNGNRICLEN